MTDQPTPCSAAPVVLNPEAIGDPHQTPVVRVPAGFMEAWSRHENAPRTPCPECAFESSEGYPPSHAPGCSQGVTDGD